MPAGAFLDHRVRVRAISLPSAWATSSAEAPSARRARRSGSIRSSRRPSGARVTTQTRSRLSIFSCFTVLVLRHGDLKVGRRDLGGFDTPVLAAEKVLQLA